MISDAVDLRRVRRVLVVKLRHHGDVLLSSPVFTVLKTHVPHAGIDALVYDETAEMLSLHPAIDMVHTVSRKWRGLGARRHALEEWRLFRTLRSRRYDLLIHLTDHPRGAWLVRGLAIGASVAPERAGRWWRNTFTHRFPVLKNGRRHTVEMHLDALRRIGIQPLRDERRLVLEPGTAAAAHIERLMQAHDLANKQFLHVHPTSRWAFKCWPTALVATMIDALASRGWRVVVTSSPAAAERAYIAEIFQQTRSHPLDLSGTLTLKQLAALTSHARLFVGVDSAPMHMAAAMGTPVVALFGPSGDIEWAPWQVPHRIVASDKFPCRPCGYAGCGDGRVSECLTSISCAQVLTAIDDLMAAEAQRTSSGLGTSHRISPQP
jgi:heptosyltransferase III